MCCDLRTDLKYVQKMIRVPHFPEFVIVWVGGDSRWAKGIGGVTEWSRAAACVAGIIDLIGTPSPNGIGRYVKNTRGICKLEREAARVRFTSPEIYARNSFFK